MTDSAAFSTDSAGGRSLDRVLRAAAVILIAGLLIITAARVARSWPNEAHLGYAEGIWLGLASDAAHGVFYRPLEGPLGYGGTRYFPLFFMANAGVIRAGLDPITAGHVLAAACVALLIVGAFVCVRRMGAGVLLGITAAAVALSCQPVQMALLTIRGDALPAALVMFGLAACLPGSRLRAAPWFFALAFAAKPTSVYGVVAAVIALAAAERRSDAWRVGWQTMAGMAVVIVLMIAASGGRVIEIFAASAAGGSGLSSVAAAPMSLARILRRVPESTFFIQVAAALLLAGLRWKLPIERTAFVVCAVTTVAIYASPATVENHLIDLSVLAIVVLGGWAAREARRMRLVMALLLVGGVASAASALWRLRTEDTLDFHSSRHAVVEALASTPGPVLVEQPMLAAERGDSPYLLDGYVLSLRAAKDPRVLDQLIVDIDRRRFGAIVFEAISLELAVAEAFPGEAGVRVRAAIERTYRLDAVVAGRPVYRPR